MKQVTRLGTEAGKDPQKVCVFTWFTGLRILYTDFSLLNVICKKKKVTVLLRRSINTWISAYRLDLYRRYTQDKQLTYSHKGIPF
jgi:hypothetical protein